MSDDTPEEIDVPHVEAAHFRTVTAHGALLSGPVDSANTWLLTFYSEGVRFKSETLTRIGPNSRAYRGGGGVKTERVRRDEVCIVLSQDQLRAVAAVLSANTSRTDEPAEHE